MRTIQFYRLGSIVAGLLLLSSCLSVDSELSDSEEKSAAMKRSRANLNPIESVIVDTLSFQSSVQSDYDIMLFSHVIMCGDSCRLILTAQDCDCLGIPEENYEKMLSYVDSLNTAAGKTEQIITE